MPQRRAPILRFRFAPARHCVAGTGRTVFGLLALFILSLANLRAQSSVSPTILLGPVAEAEGTLSLSDNPISVYSLSSACGTFDRVGRGTGMRFGIEGRIAPAGWSRFGLIGRIALETGSERFTAFPLDEQRTTNEETGEIETLQREFRLDHNSTTLAAEPLAEYRAGKGWSVAAGFRVGYRLNQTFRQTDNILGPGDRRFEDGQATHPMEEGIAFTPAQWSLGPVLAASYLFSLKNGLIVAPGLSLRADLLSPAHEAAWRTYSLSAGAALFFNLSPQLPPPPFPPDRPTPPPVPEVPLPQARVRIYGLDESGRQTEVGAIRMWEVLYEQRLPLLPSIFFDHESATMPERYAGNPALSPEVSMSAADSTGDFDWTLMRANHHLPGILAERMARNPGSILEIAGSTSEDESPEEGRQRSELIKSVLTAQGISADRIRTVPPQFKRSDERTPEGKEENRRVEITSRNSELTDPLTLRQIVRDFSPPAIRVSPDFEAVAGVKQWRIEIRYNDSLMADYTNEERAAGEAPDFSWRITQRHGDTTIAPIVASFSITDSLGRESTAWDTIQVVLDERRSVIDRDTEKGITHERSSLWIIGFEYDSELLTEQQKREMEVIAGKIRNNARVKVTGYTDRIGTESHNTVLSLHRAEAVAAQLKEMLARQGISNVAVEAVGAGVDQGLFNNDLPEGRRLSRSVVITVEQEIN